MPRITIEFDTTTAADLPALRAVIAALSLADEPAPCALEGAERAAAVVANWPACKGVAPYVAPDAPESEPQRLDDQAAAFAELGLVPPVDEPQRLDDDQAASLAFAPPTPPTGPVLDSQGMPWDARIHSESKSTNADGTWRNKRGVAPGERAAIAATLKAQVAPVAAEPAPVAPPPPPAAPATATEPTLAAMVPPPPPAAPPLPVGTSFDQFMQRLTPRVVGGSLTLQQVQAACIAAGAANTLALRDTPELIPLVLTQLEQLLGGPL